MPRKIAITGGIATGKSTVAAMFARRGAVILDADKVAREVVQPGASGWEGLRRVLDPSFFNADGQLNRRRLRECIISDPACRAKVNAAMHPAILQAMDAQWQAVSAALTPCVVLFDIPLLFELDLDSHFELILLVYVPEAGQAARLMHRDGISREEALKNLAMQLPIEVKRRRAHRIIDNSGDLESTERQVEEIWEELNRATAPSAPPL